MQYIVSTSPHLKAEQDISVIMKLVCIALIPSFIWAAFNFGWHALWVTGLCVAACVATEAVCLWLRGKPVLTGVGDYSAVVSGLLLAAVLPPNVSWHVAILGGIFAMAVAKHAFGGLGNNIWNPALLSRAFLQVAYAAEINSPIWPRVNEQQGLWQNLSCPLSGSFAALAERTPDVVSSATMLARIAYPKTASADFRFVTNWSEVWNGFIGLEGGVIAEVSALFLLLGGLFLLWQKIITWEIPVCYIATVGVLTWVLPAPFKYQTADMTDAVVRYTPWFCGPWALHLVGGGLFIGAFFMATDMVTTPMSFKGRVVFGLGCGLLTVLIRLYSSAYPEGVCYSILLMNTCVPLIDAWTRPRKFGLRPAAAKAA